MTLGWFIGRAARFNVNVIASAHDAVAIAGRNSA